MIIIIFTFIIYLFVYSWPVKITKKPKAKNKTETNISKSMASKVFVFDLKSVTNFPKNENFLPPHAHTHVSNTDLETNFLKLGKLQFWECQFFSIVTSKVNTVLDIPLLINLFISLIELKKISGALSGLRQFLVTESLLKMMKNAFYFTLKSPFILEVFRFLFSLFGHVRKRLVKGTLMQIWKSPYKFVFT